MNESSTSAIIHEVNLVMNRIAERKLQDTLGISYSRFVFLYTIEQHRLATQHTLAQALKISDPAVSKLCAEGMRGGMLHITTNPQHKRQRLVSLTTLGHTTLQQSIALLDSCFSDICVRAEIDEANYREQTTRLLHSLNIEYNKIMRGDHD